MGMEKPKEMGLWGMSETFRFQMSFLNKAKCQLYIYIFIIIIMCYYFF